MRPAIPIIYTTVMFLFVCDISLQAQLSKTERNIVRFVETRNAAALKLLERVVNINSGTMNFEGVMKVGGIFSAQLDALGFKTKWIDGKAFQRAGHLLAEHKGKGKTILLIGHLDTVFELSSPFQHYQLLNDSIAQGPGVGDMKGGNVIMIQALQALHDAGLLKDMNIIVMMGGDEESSGKPLSLSRHDLVEAARSADVAIGFEDGDGNPKTANISRRSSTDWELKVTGVPSHSSQIFTDKIGAGAIYEACRIVNAFYEALVNEPNLTFSPGVILGGTTTLYSPEKNGGEAYGKNNVVAKDVIVTGDIRSSSPEQLKHAQEVMYTLVEKHHLMTNAKLTFAEGYPPMAPTAGNHKLLTYFSKVSLDLGYDEVIPVNPRDAGAADISFAAEHVDMAIDGLGPGSSGGHTVNETANIYTLSMQAKRTAVLLYRLTNDRLMK
jgi:glutamate carboxypeptidase